jgi:5'-phosphate synthase pdxT subunit
LDIGVLALQGAFIEHVTMLRKLGVDAVEVRLPGQLDNLAGLIIPGGESTTIGKLAVTYGLVEPIRRKALAGWPIWGTCAGMIFLAKNIGRGDQPLLGVMDVVVRRNAFGRQVQSFVAELDVPLLDGLPGAAGQGPFPAMFIRAPLIESVGKGVEVLASLSDGTIVAAREGNLLVTSFHPDLTGDSRFHELFLQMVESVARR